MRLLHILITMYALLLLASCAKPVTVAAASGVEGLSGDVTPVTLADSVTLADAVTP